jgi:hypothetical protein
VTRTLAETHNPFSENALKEIFKVKAGKPSVIVSRENNRLEFRETFSLNACKDKLRTFAAFANNQGGYLVFGVKDRPRELKGITGTAFDDLKTDKLTGMLNEYFAPEIHWAAHEYEFEGMTFGLLYVYESQAKPVVCLKHCDAAKRKEGEIYYRYRGRSEAIRYPELRELLDEVRNQERVLWMKFLENIAKIGVQNAAIMDTVTGEVTGRSGSFLIDEALLPKISFIKEGHFVESKAAPALKLIGDVEVIDSHLIQPTRRVVKKTKGINLPDIVNAFLDQEDVPDAAEYISAICYQTTSLLPVYYFMIQGRLSVEDVIALIDSSKSTSQARRKLKERVSTAASRNKDQEPAQPGNLNATAADCRRRVSNRNLPDSPDEIELKHILTAILTLCRNEIDTKYLFPRLKTWFENSYSGMDTYAKSLFRRVLVHLDTVLYANSVSYGSAGGGTHESY